MQRKEKEFMSVTNTSLKEAQKYLKETNYNVQKALEKYFDSTSTFNELFDQYKDNEDTILANGTERLLQDLGLDPSDPVTIVLSYYFNSPTMCEFTKQGFTKGCQDLQIRNLSDLKSQLPKMKSEIHTKKVYTYTFQFAKSENQKSLELDTALAFWDLVIEFTYLQEWKEFVQQKGKAISKDTWNLFYDFVSGFTGFKNHDLDGAWPLLIDQFVEEMLNKGHS